MHDSSDVETHSLRTEGRMFVAFACLTRKKGMKRKTEEEYSMNSTGEYQTLFYQGLTISNPNSGSYKHSYRNMKGGPPKPLLFYTMYIQFDEVNLSIPKIS